MVVLKTSVEILIFLKKFFEILREIGEGTEFTFFKLHKWFTYQKKPWGPLAWNDPNIIDFNFPHFSNIKRKVLCIFFLTSL